MSRLKKEYLRRCYSLSWDIEAIALLFSIEKRLIPKIKALFEQITQNRPDIIPVSTADNFSEIGETGKSFGFQNQFVYEAETDTDITYRWVIPSVLYQTKKKCPECKGTLFTEYGNKCRSCRQTGKKFEPIEDGKFTDGMLTLYFLLDILGMIILDESDKEANEDDRRQLVHVEISRTMGMCNCWILGWVSDEVSQWIDEAPNEDAKPITKAMGSVEERLYYRNVEGYDFRFSAQSGKRFWFQVPGSACTLGTDTGTMNLYSTGVALSPHNVDHRTAQLSFIAGLAALSDQVRKSITTKPV
jgi:hypothetical protein